MTALANDVAASPVVPQQMRGSAQNLPSLLPATQLEQVAEPGGGWKAQVQPPEGAVPAEDRTQDTGTQTDEDLPAGVRNAEQAERAVLAVPSLVDVYPKQGYLVDVLRPTLRAWGSSNNGGSALSYSFKICDVEAMSGSGCTDSGYVSGNRNNWQVPAGKLAWGKQYWWRVTIRDPYDFSTTDSPLLTFTTGVRQPVVSSLLATPGAGGQEFNQQTGNYTATFTDLTVATAGPPLSVVRTYNSMDPRTDGMFGVGWSTRWDMKVAKEVRGASTSALVTYPDGRQVRFISNGDGTFQPPPGMYATLAEESGGEWRLMDKSATTYLFNSSGKLTEIKDSRERTQTLTYDVGGKLTTVSGVGGRSITFTWQGDQVASVSSDPVGGQPLTWTYTYDAGRLEQVCAPVAAPNCTTYAYGSGSLYRSRVLDSDPFGYWRLGEASGTTGTDLGSGAGDLTYQGVTLGQQGALTGTTDTAATFQTGSIVKLPSNTIPHLGDQLSVEAWFKTSQSGVLVAAGTQQTGDLARGAMLYVGTDGKLRGALDAVMTPITSTGTVNDGQWHHVVLTVAGEDQTLYLDGQQAGTTTGAGTAWRTYATIGNGVTDPAKSPAVPSGVQAFPLQGQMDEVALYGKPLTAAEVQAHYAARAGATHQLSTITLPSGRVWASNTYDGKTDRIATHTDNHGGTWQIGDLGINQQYGEAQVTVTDPDDETLVYLYDAWRGYRIRGETDQLEYTTWYEYDQAGFLKKVIDRNNIANEIYQDKRGNTLGRQYCRAPGECAIEFWTYYLNANDPFDPRNDRVVAYRDGRSNSDTDNTYASTTVYNSYGEPTAQTSPKTTDFPSGRSTSVTYTDGTESAVGGGSTPAGLVKTRTDPRGNVWSYRYTAAGDLAEQTDPEGLVTELEHDLLGRLVSSTRISDAVPAGAETTIAYDGRGRVTTSTAPGVENEITEVTHTAQSRYVYDADGNVLSQTVADLTGGEPDRVTTYTYDSHGRQETITGPEGGVVQQVFNERGWLMQTTDPRGTVIESGYSKRGELVSRTLKGWTGSPVNPQAPQDLLLESYAYDAAGRWVASVEAMGRKTTNVYWTDNRLKEQIADDAKLNGSTTPRDVVVRADEYDPAGNLIEQMAGHGTAITVFTYDQASRLVSQTLDPGALARTTTLAYDANTNVTSKTLTAAGTSRTESTSYAYNKLNQITRETVENGAQDIISTLGYDERGLVTSITDPRGNADGATAADYTTTLRYDALERLVETTAPEVQVDKNGTTSQTSPSALIGYDTAGNQTHQTDPEGRTHISAYDKAGRLISATAPAYTPPGGSPITPVIQHAYDAAGLRTSTTDPRGNVTGYTYDQLGRQVRVTDPAPAGQTAGTWVTEYNEAGETRVTTDPTGARAEATYDDLGRQITSTRIERKPSTAAYVSRMEYDDAGRLVKQIAPGNKTTIYTVNPAGDVTAVKDPANQTTTMDYDVAGRLIKTTDPLGNATTAEYDLAGRQTAAKDLNSGGIVQRTFSYGYDAAGNPTSATTPEGHTTEQTFDALSRLTSLIEPVSASESITTSFGYDAAGARTRLTDGRGNATWTAYNSLGLPETVTEPATTVHPNLSDRTWTHLYDAAGNQVATVQPGGVRIDRIFDHLGRLTDEDGSGGGAATAERSFGYDLAGRATTIGDLSVDYNDRSLPLTVSKGGSQQSAYSYDALGNPIQRIDAAGTAAFTWDNNSRLQTATDPVTGRTLTYGYDAASRLKTITATSGQASTQTFDYDAMDRLTGHTLKNGSGTQLAKITYGWDKDDNLTTKTTTGTAGAGTNTYGYDHAGRLTSWTAPGGTTTAYEWDASGNRTKAGSKTFTYDERNRLTSGDGTDYTYTPRGTLAGHTRNGTTTSYTFDAFDRLIADGDSLYSYDALNRVTSRIRGTTNQTFAYSGLGNDLATISAGGTLQAKYSRDAFGALLGLQEAGGSAVAALSDLHGDLVATFTTSLTSSTSYDPFGAVTARTGAATTLGYQGEYTDPDTGKVNMHARWYQPVTGTFTSRDTATLNPRPSVQANRYTYANAAPLTGIDPTGHYTTSTGLGTDSGSGYSGAGCSIGYLCLGAGGGDALNGGFKSPGTGYGDISAYAGTTMSYGGGCVDSSSSICHETYVNERWWSDLINSPGYDYDSSPLMSDEEAKRIGVMNNGRPVDQPFFWDDAVSEEVRNAYMAGWYPEADDIRLMNNWALAGGAMATAHLYASGGYAGGPIYSPKKLEFKYYDTYKRLLRYHKTIAKAATNHGINKNVLTAVLLWEINQKANKYGAWSQFADWVFGNLGDRKNQGAGVSVGIAQLEIYKVRMMMMKHYGKKEWEGKTIGEYAEQAFNPNRAIHLAAAWLAHLKENVWYMKGGVKHYLDDREAAIAYCGCSGVTVDNPISGNTKLTTTKFRAWAESGWQDKALQGNSRLTGIARRNQILTWLSPGHAADEFCNRVGWEKDCD
ncbi:LamG-like jellyroll fold domain-containing protein [Nonomuraea sp. CA-218870]